MIRFAIVGIGGYGWQLVRSITEVAEELDCKLVAAADSRLGDLAERAQTLAGTGVELFDDATKMFDKMKGRCDAIYICTSIPSHEPLACAAARGGYHIHLEKPPAATVQATDRIVEAIDKAGVLCMLGFHNIHGQEMLLLKKRICDGRLGQMKSLVATASLPRKRFYYTRNNWAGQLRLGDDWVLDGPAGNAAAHEINSMLFLASSDPGRYACPVAVRAELYAAGPIKAHDTAAIEIQTDGPTVWLFVSHCTAEKAEPCITVEGELGKAVWRAGHVRITYADGSSEELSADRQARANMVTHLVEAIRNGDESKLLTRPIDGRNMVAALNAAHESSRTIHRITPDFIAPADDQAQAATVVENMVQYIKEAAQQHCLFSQLPDAPPWAVATRSFDLTGYEDFPKQFTCD